MKIVIDIDEKDYEFIKSVKSIMKNSDTFQRISASLFNAVKTGEIVYPTSVAPIADNNDASGMINWSIKEISDENSN